MKRTLFCLTICGLLTSFLYAQTYSVSGTVIDKDGERATQIPVLLLKPDETAVGRTETSKGGLLKKGGKYEFKDVLPGNYILSVDAGEQGQARQRFQVTDRDIEDQEIKLAKAAPVKPAEKKPAAGIPAAAAEVTGKDYILNELSFENKKLAAEVKHLNTEVENLKALSKMWVNPLAIYSKEIIMKNGSTIFGKIVYQDEKTLKVETLVGYLVLDRANVVRIVDNVVTQETHEYVPEQIRDSYSPPPLPKLAEPKYTAAAPAGREAGKKYSANCVLVGNISESKDKQSNIIFAGEVKNIGGRRADFVKVDFVFRKNWSGETKTLTTFVRGTYHTFDSGITTDATLLPGAVGRFELYVPHSFGSFIGYSYVIDWEEYE